MTALPGCPGFGDERAGSTLNEVPERPNWDEHVAPIMERYCVSCHGASASQGAPGHFRLDTCEEADRPGAQAMVGRVVARAVESPAAPMPPASTALTMGEIDQLTLVAWRDVGAPCDADDPGVSPDSNGGGGGEVPDVVWYEHVKPILDGSCIGCHGETPAGGAPAGMRLDVCEDPERAAASDLSGRIVARVSESPANPMPPEGLPGVAESDQAILRAWRDGGAPCTEEEALAGGGGGGGGYHPEGWSDPASHGRAAKLAEDDCRACHGADLTGEGAALSCDTCHTEGWRTSCARCHGGEENPTGAPPRGIDPTRPDPFPRHTAHVVGTIHGGVDCVQCHTVPTDVLSPGHMWDGTPAMAEVDFSGGQAPGARWDDAAQACSNVYCHGTGRAPGSWSVGQGSPTCASCHPGMASGRDGWGRMSGEHEDHLREGISCEDCHGGTVSGPTTIRDRALHVNGEVDLALQAGMSVVGRGPVRCSGTCHGEEHASETW